MGVAQRGLTGKSTRRANAAFIRNGQEAAAAQREAAARRAREEAVQCDCASCIDHAVN